MLCTALMLDPSPSKTLAALSSVELVKRLESEGAEALRPHIEESTRALLEQA